MQSENNLFPDRKDWYWGLDELKQYLEKDHLARHTANYHAILAKREAELSPDEAARQYALTQLNKFPLDSTIIKVYNMAPSRKSAIKKAWKELPSEIGNYTQLTSLVVDSHFLKELPDSLANLTCLKSLHLGNNRFKVLPAIVGELKTLELLDLEWSAHLEAFPPEIGKLTNLKRIHLKSCTNFKEIPDEMVKLLNLEYIDLTDVNAAHNLKRRLNKLLPNCKVKNFQETN